MVCQMWCGVEAVKLQQGCFHPKGEVVSTKANAAGTALLEQQTMNCFCVHFVYLMWTVYIGALAIFCHIHLELSCVV